MKTELLDDRYSLLSMIVDRKQAQKIIEFGKKLQLTRYTSFRGKGTLSNSVLKFLELDDVPKEIILFIVPTIDESKRIDQFTEKFQFGKPNKGILYTISLSHLTGMTQEAPEADFAIPNDHTGIVGLCVIVDEGKAEDILDLSNKELFLGGTIIPAHGSADQSKKVFDHYVERHKEMILMLVPMSRVRLIMDTIESAFHLKDKNTGILFTFAIHQVRGLVDRKISLEELNKTEIQPDWSDEQTPFDAIWAIVPSGSDSKVIEAAEKAGSRGGTIIHARGAHAREIASLLAPIEPEREVVIILSNRKNRTAIMKSIHEELGMNESGHGIVFSYPIHESIGVFEA